MLLIVVALFALCWLPLQLYNLLAVLFPEINMYVSSTLNIYSTLIQVSCCRRTHATHGVTPIAWTVA